MSPVILFGVVVMLGLGLIIFGMVRARQPDAIGERLNQFTERVLSLEEMELQQPFHQRVLVPILNSLLNTLGKYGPKQSAERLRSNIWQAGSPGGLTPNIFVGMRVAIALGLGVVITIITMQTMVLSQALMYSAMGFLLGYMMPVRWLGRQITGRKKAITKPPISVPNTTMMIGSISVILSEIKTVGAPS